MLEPKFSLQLDGQEAAMIIFALREKADRLDTETMRRMYRVLAARVEREKVEFHGRTYDTMAGKYRLPGR